MSGGVARAATGDLVIMVSGPRDRFEGTHERRRDAGDDGIGPAELEAVAGRRVAPRNALNRHDGLDPVDDFAGGERSHHSGLQ